jgi:hypothetical protein
MKMVSLKVPRNCLICGQSFLPTNWKQRYCKPCGIPAEIERARQWKRAYYKANAKTLLAKARVRWAERKKEGCVPLRKGHPYSPPKDSVACRRCGRNFLPASGSQKWCPQCKPLAIKEVKGAIWVRYRQTFRDKVKQAVFGHYSNGSFACSCCGESQLDFLTLDHINNDGARERKRLREVLGFYPAGVGYYRWLQKSGFPPGLQVYCANCNFSKSKHGECIHKPKVTPASSVSEVYVGDSR